MFARDIVSNGKEFGGVVWKVNIKVVIFLVCFLLKNADVNRDHNVVNKTFICVDKQEKLNTLKTSHLF